MSLRRNLQLLRGGLSGRGTRRRGGKQTASNFWEKSRVIGGLIFIITVASIVLISFVGVNTVDLPVLPGQLATVRVAATSTFSYVSKERTRLASDAALRRIPPVYRLDFAAADQFQWALRDLLTELEAFERRFPPNATSVANRQQALQAIAERFNARGAYNLSADDVSALLAIGDARQRATLIDNGVMVLRDIYARGIGQEAFQAPSELNSITVYQVVRPSGEITERPVQTMTQALTSLRANLTADGARDPSGVLFRLFRQGVTNNVVYDQQATDRRKAAALATLKNVVVNVERGQTIVEAGTRVTPDQYEMLMAQRSSFDASEDAAADAGLRLFGRILLVLAMVMASVFYICLEDRETLQSNGRLALLALVVIVNLALVRATYSLLGTDFFLQNSSWASTLPYIAPTALAPLIVAILIDAGSAIFMALLISIFTGVIYGNRLDLLVLTFLASMVAIFASRQVHKRSKVVRAAGLAGLTVAAFALLIGFVEQTPWTTLSYQMGAGLGTALLTGIVVVGVLPVLEGLFKRTTDITLLELTDFNHPLLRLMQLEAPGTYHHSIVVAQLAENACNAIGANPLLARVCALFHDVGKTARPEYFTENQVAGTPSPHNPETPGHSAAIIKSHVKDGAELAEKHNLPRAVIDVIEQHHGTSLVRYFYDRAVAGAASRPVPEADFRYDGPKPQFKESAVISIADAVEASSRSLRQIDAVRLGTLIDRIFRDRMADGQLDEAPLTFAELAQIKSSFIFTLLNMLHARASYATSTELEAKA